AVVRRVRQVHRGRLPPRPAARPQDRRSARPASRRARERADPGRPHARLRLQSEPALAASSARPPEHDADGHPRAEAGVAGGDVGRPGRLTTGRRTGVSYLANSRSLGAGTNAVPRGGTDEPERQRGRVAGAKPYGSGWDRHPGRMGRLDAPEHRHGLLIRCANELAVPPTPRSLPSPPATHTPPPPPPHRSLRPAP